MEALSRQIFEYIAPSGSNPFREWLDGLSDRKAQALIDVRIANVRRGTFGDCKPLGHGVFELKLSYGPGYRIYIAMDGGAVVLLLCGGSKKSQSRDIQRAYQYLEDYRKRK